MRSKLMKIVTIGLFVVAMLLNVSVYFDANDSQNADLSLGSLKVSLFQKAYAGEIGELTKDAACDAAGCPDEWWHSKLCATLEVAPGGIGGTWYCYERGPNDTPPGE